MEAGRATDDELVAELRLGSSSALGELFDRYADRVYNYCFRQVGSWHQAEDLTSATFLEVWRARERAAAYDGTALPWLYGVATNVCRNATRVGPSSPTSRADLTPPPGRRLDDDTKARLRAELIAATGVPEQTSSTRGWLVPAIAAAGVAALLAGGAWLLSGDGGGTAQPAGGGDATTAAQQTATAEPTDQATNPPMPTSTTGPAAINPEQVCGSAVTLEGATLTTFHPYELGTVTIWTAGDRWQVCDTFAAIDGGPPTLFAIQSGNADQPERLRLSQNTVEVDGKLRSEYVAGGLIPNGVTRITYSFPDGTEVDAVLEGDAWTMVYLPTTGPLSGESRVNLTSLDPVTVHVWAGGDNADSYPLEWGVDTCAQVNHGC